MQKIIFREQIQNYSDCINQSIVDYIVSEAIETYESFDRFSLISFDWYNIYDLTASPAQIIIYIDKEDLFYICENQISYDLAQTLFEQAESNERALYLFFRNLFKGKAQHLEEVEDRISALDDLIMEGSNAKARDELMTLKYETLRLKKFYEPLESLFEELCSNDNALLSDGCLKYCLILRNRAADLTAKLQNLREYIAQVRESYQTQIGIEQNNLMKVFTLVTSIFLPLTLLVGWYGMNFNMPEFRWRFGYLGVILLSLSIGVLWYILFKKKKWFK